MSEIKLTMRDYNCEDGTRCADQRPWSVDIEAAEFKTTIVATAPDGTKREVWIEIAHGHLVAHCYDAGHDEPLNVRMGKGDIATDDDRDGDDISHQRARVEPMAINDRAMFDLLCENFDAWDGEEDSVKEEHADLIAKTDAFLEKAKTVIHGAPPAAPKAGRVPTTAFVEGNWSFRPTYDERGVSGFKVYPKGERSYWSRNADMNLASDGKTWMFVAFRHGQGRQDARPTFAEAKAEVLRVLNQAEG